MSRQSSSDSFYQLVTSFDADGNVRSGEKWHDFNMHLEEQARTLPGKWEVAAKSVSYTNGFDQVIEGFDLDVMWLIRDESTRDWLKYDMSARTDLPQDIARRYNPHFKYGYIENLTIKTGNRYRRARVKGGSYKGSADFIKEINSLFSSWWLSIGQTYENSRTLWLDPSHDRMSIHPAIPEGHQCIAIPLLNEHVSKLLGIPEPNTDEFVRMVLEYEMQNYNCLVSPSMIDFKEGKHILTLNTSLVESTVPDDGAMNVLKILPDDSGRQFNEQITHEFNNMTYLPVNTSALNKIGLSLKYEGSKRLANNFTGILAAMLHFRVVK